MMVKTLMRLRNPILAAFILLTLSACLHNAETSSTSPIPATQEGDYLTLVLSWSPTYCLTDAGENDRQQCGLRANRGRHYAFVVHGLWPQYDRRRSGRPWPENCISPAPWIDDGDIDAALGFMPSKRLVIHEWKKHGTCYSKSPEKYVRAMKLLFRSIAIPSAYQQTTDWLTVSPDTLRDAFLEANPQFSSEMISVQCGNRKDRARLKEIRFCFSGDGRPDACGPNEKRQCRAKKLILPPVR